MEITEAARNLSLELKGVKCRVHAGMDTIFVELYYEADKNKIPSTYNDYPVEVKADPAGPWFNAL